METAINDRGAGALVLVVDHATGQVSITADNLTVADFVRLSRILQEKAFEAAVAEQRQSIHQEILAQSKEAQNPNE